MSLSWGVIRRVDDEMAGYSDGADLVKGTERLRILLVGDNQGPLFKREVGQT